MANETDGSSFEKGRHKIGRDRRPVGFLEPMECEPVGKLPEGREWTYEAKWDGYRALAIKSDGRLELVSRRNKPLGPLFPELIAALEEMEDGTVLDGELVALDETGRPSFSLLQNYRKGVELHYYAFDLLFHRQDDLTAMPLTLRRRMLKSVLRFDRLVRYSETLNGSAEDILRGLREHGLEGVIAKRNISLYEPGKRSGAWVKLRLHQGQEFVIGGFVPGPYGLDSLILGYYKGSDLMYVAKVRAGLNPFTKKRLHEQLGPFVVEACPFANLPETKSHRWGEGLTASKMAECVWVKPELVAQIEYVNWTEADHLRHAKFVGMRDDKNARDIVKEHSGKT